MLYKYKELLWSLFKKMNFDQIVHSYKVQHTEYEAMCRVLQICYLRGDIV